MRGAGGIGFVLGSTKDLECVFYKGDGTSEAYNGVIRKFGIDLGVTAGGVLAWTVFAATRRLPPTELTGKYDGLNVDASMLVGGGADILVGGSRRTISLQPLSLKGQVGLNLAVGIAEVQLKPVFVHKAVWDYHGDPRNSDNSPPERFFTDIPHYGCGSYFVLRERDTLSGIARLCGITVEALLKANRDITNVRELPVGMVVKVPAQTGHHKTAPCGREAILQPGEHLDQLAWRCGVTLHSLLRRNPQLRSSASIKAGLVLRVPTV